VLGLLGLRVRDGYEARLAWPGFLATDHENQVTAAAKGIFKVTGIRTYGLILLRLFGLPIRTSEFGTGVTSVTGVGG